MWQRNMVSLADSLDSMVEDQPEGAFFPHLQKVISCEQFSMSVFLTFPLQFHSRNPSDTDVEKDLCPS